MTALVLRVAFTAPRVLLVSLVLASVIHLLGSPTWLASAATIPACWWLCDRWLADPCTERRGAE